MSEKMSAESLGSTTDDEENCLNHLSLQASLSRIDFLQKNDIISPEDIAAVAFPRIFNEDSNFPPNLSTIHEISVRKRAFFNEDSKSTTGRIYPKTPIIRSPAGQQLQSLQTPAIAGHGTPKSRQKSPSNRPHLLHPPFSIEGISSRGAANSVRKTKSTALPAIIKKTWPRSASASTPELKLDDQGIVIERLPSNTGRESNRQVYLVRTTSYYNFRLIYIILNCVILVIGFVYLGAAIALWVYKELVLIIVDYRVHVSSVICLFGLALFLLAITTSGLCLVRNGPKKTAAVSDEMKKHIDCQPSETTDFAHKPFFSDLKKFSLLFISHSWIEIHDLATTHSEDNCLGYYEFDEYTFSELPCETMKKTLERKKNRNFTCQHAGCSLVMGAVLVALAFLQSASQLTIEVDAEFRMLSTIRPGSATANVWDYLHHTFKCCGVRGYLDWCQRINGNSKIYTSAEDFLGSFTCNIPESCCLNNKIKLNVLKSFGYTSCVVAPTPSNTHRSGCLNPILIVISYLGKTYRIGNFVTAFILLLTTTTSMILFTYL